MTPASYFLSTSYFPPAHLPNPVLSLRHGCRTPCRRPPLQRSLSKATHPLGTLPNKNHHHPPHVPLPTHLQTLHLEASQRFPQSIWRPPRPHTSSTRFQARQVRRATISTSRCEFITVQHFRHHITNHPQASFCAGATLATITWTKIPDPLWIADALWFSSLTCSIWAVITSIKTKSILDDIPDRDLLNLNLPEMELKRAVRVIVRYKKTPGWGHWIMLFIWQFPSMMMSYAWCTFISGLSICKYSRDGMG